MRLDPIRQPLGKRGFGHFRPVFMFVAGQKKRAIAVTVEYRTSVSAGHSIGNQPIAPLACQFCGRVGLQIFRFGGKADNKPGTVAMPRQRGQNVWILDKLQLWHGPLLLFQLTCWLAVAGFDAPVGDCSSTDCDVSRQCRLTGGQHVTRRFHRNVGDICWRLLVDRSADKGDFCAARCQRSGNGVPLLAG